MRNTIYEQHGHRQSMMLWLSLFSILSFFSFHVQMLGHMYLSSTHRVCRRPFRLISPVGKTNLPSHPRNDLSQKTSETRYMNSSIIKFLYSHSHEPNASALLRFRLFLHVVLDKPQQIS